MIYELMCSQIDRERERYDKKSEANRENGRKGGRPKKSEENPKEPKESERFPQETQVKTQKPYKEKEKEEEKEEEDINNDDDDDILACVREGFLNSFGREATGEEAAYIASTARRGHMEPLLVEELIAKAARNGARVPAAYVNVLMADAASSWVRKLSEYERLCYLQDVIADKINPEGLSIDEVSSMMLNEYKERRERYEAAAEAH